MQEGSFNWDSLTCYPLSRIERGADLAAAVDGCGDDHPVAQDDLEQLHQELHGADRGDAGADASAFQHCLSRYAVGIRAGLSRLGG